MNDKTQEIIDLERELNVKLDLTDREKAMLEAIQFLLDRFVRASNGRAPR